MKREMFDRVLLLRCGIFKLCLRHKGSGTGVCRFDQKKKKKKERNENRQLKKLKASFFWQDR